MSARSLVPSNLQQPMAALQLTIHRITWVHAVGLIGILCVGAFVRFYNPQIIDWSSDHSDIALIAQDIVAGNGISLVGNPSSAGLPNSPFFIYVLIIPYMFSDNPIIVTGFVTALNLAGVALLWLIAFRYLGPATALGAGLAYAVHPWAVHFGRSIWSGDHRAFLLLVGVLVGLRGFLEGRRWAQILCLPLMLIALQIHYAAWPLLPLYFWLVWMGWRTISWRTLALSAGLGLLVVLPFAIGIVQTLSSTTVPVTVQAQTRDLSLNDLIKPFGQMFWLTTGLGTEQYVARQNAADLLSSLGPIRFLWILQGLAVALGVAHIWRAHSQQFALFVGIWAFLPLATFALPIIGVYPHYFIPAIPALCLLTGAGIPRLYGELRGRNAVAGAVTWTLYGTIFVTQAGFLISTFDYINTHYTPTQFGFGTPVHYFLDARDEFAQRDNLVFITSDDWLDQSRTGSHVWAPFLRQSATCLRDISASSKVAVFPATPFYAVFAPRAPASPTLDQLYRTERGKTFDLRPGEGSYEVHQIDRIGKWPGPEIRSIEPVRFENGVTLTGYHIAAERTTLTWVLPGAEERNYKYSITFLGHDGRVLATHSDSFWPSTNWCAGDRLVNWADIAVPGGARSLRVSLSPVGRGQSLRAMGSAGQTASDGAVIVLPGS